MIDNNKCHDPIDELLERVWILVESGQVVSADGILSLDTESLIDKEMIEEAVRDGFLEQRDGIFEFTQSGRERGESIIRRHRLAERLLMDVLNMEKIGIESDACRFEHFLSPEVTDRICTLLGHPRKCPHGKDIPLGTCCRKAEDKVESAVIPLSELSAGGSGRVLYISTQSHQRLDRLTSMGIFPGRVVKVHQREPLFVVFLDQTQLALDREIVREIFVLRS